MATAIQISLDQERIEDYMRFGIPNIWIIDPKTRDRWDCSQGNWNRAERFEVAETHIYLSLNELFAQLDAYEA